MSEEKYDKEAAATFIHRCLEDIEKADKANNEALRFQNLKELVLMQLFVCKKELELPKVEDGAFFWAMRQAMKDFGLKPVTEKEYLRIMEQTERDGLIERRKGS